MTSSLPKWSVLSRSSLRMLKAALRTWKGLGVVLVRRFPFGVIYQPRGEQLVVIAVAHQRRRPGYWLRRL